MNKKVIVFDLDDTIYKEIDFLKSAYKEIAELVAPYTNKDASIIFNSMLTLYKDGNNAFQGIIDEYSLENFNISKLLDIYRNHKPKISLPQSTLDVLKEIKELGIPMGIITDGRTNQQRNKIEALQIEAYFENIIISEEFGSEKPNPENYLYFEKQYPNRSFFYIGDNVSKDFISANKLGWITICLLDKGFNIHPQDFSVSKIYHPKFRVNEISEVMDIIKKD